MSSVRKRDAQGSNASWLLASTSSIEQARTEWKTTGVAWLKPENLFAAVKIPASLVHAAVGLSTPLECAGPLAEVLAEGPLYFETGGFGPEDSYTALLPAHVARLEMPAGLVLHPPRALLQVPAPDVCEPDGGRPWWVVPPGGPWRLCPPELLAALVGLGRDCFRARGSDE